MNFFIKWATNKSPFIQSSNKCLWSETCAKKKRKREKALKQRKFKSKVIYYKAEQRPLRTKIIGNKLKVKYFYKTTQDRKNGGKRVSYRLQSHIFMKRIKVQEVVQGNGYLTVF